MSPASQAKPVAKARDEDRLLALLAEPGAHARRDEGIVQVVVARKGVPLVRGRFPMAVLAPLLSSGAVRCDQVAGLPRYQLTAEGRAAVFRRQSGEDAFGDQHRLLEKGSGPEGAPVKRNLREDPLALLARQEGAGFAVDEASREAGERLRRDIEMACLPPKVTINWDRLVVDGAGPGTGLTMTEAQAQARKRVQNAMLAVGPDFSGPLMDLCGFGRSVGEIEQGLGLPVRSGKVVLSLGLRALARHYGLSSMAQGTARQPIRHWGAADSRPAFPKTA
ncbi:MAG: ATPase [Methylobacterium sp.]|nr:ATPase [Methylobacterium sp.]MCA3605199.1 ATPase [Methylobacterium sp.]MCA3608782.1 ATPase [Methylobacterium sp.]MCA3616642.1 ATPase [Methylobacterium sp.]MCA3620388.1 ATPase [Methylobacterium sp.]